MSLGNHLERACTEQLVRTCFVRERDPVAARAVVLDVAAQQVVLLGRPRPPLHTRLVAARRPTHAGAAAAAARAWNGIEELGGGAGWGGGGGWRPCVFWHKVGRQQGQQASCGLWGAQACFIAAGRQAASHLESLSQHQLQARVRGLGPGIVGVGQVRPFCGAVPVPPRPYYCSSLSQFVLQKKYIHTFCFYNTHVCVDQYLRVLLLVSLVNPSGCACPQVYKWRLSFVPLPPPASTR
jgi:hypothetical protein